MILHAAPVKLSSHNTHTEYVQSKLYCTFVGLMKIEAAISKDTLHVIAFIRLSIDLTHT